MRMQTGIPCAQSVSPSEQIKKKHRGRTEMTLANKATRIRLADFTSAPMRAFHMSWFAFFICFFGWFGLAPLMPVIRQEFHLTKAQIGNLTIASVLITVVVRALIGFLCDRIGPRRAYTWL